MVASTTTKKHRKKFNKKLYEKATEQATVEAVTEVMSRILVQWTSQQLDKLAYDKEFVCVDLGKHIYKIGKFSLHRHHETSWVVKNAFLEPIYDFYNKQAAVLFCLYETREMFHKSQEFLNYDRELGSLQEQVNYYVMRYKKAVKKRDNFGSDLYLARLSCAKPLLENVQTNLQKSIITAKYSKAFGEIKNETARTRN